MFLTIKRILEKEFIPVAACVFAVFIFTTLGKYTVIPAWRERVLLRSEVAKYRKLISGDSKYNELKKIIRKKHAQLEQKHTSLTQGLADPRDLSGLLQMIFDKAWEAGIRFDKTIPEQEIKDKDYIHYPIVLEMTTTFNRMGQFTSLLEQIPQIVRVERVSLIARDTEAVSARMLITCFVSLKPEEHADDAKK